MIASINQALMKILVFGANGWIGSQFIKLLEESEYIYQPITPPPLLRADDEEGVNDFLVQTQPDRVVSFIGRTHGPGFTTIDYLEQKGKLVENVKDNLFAPTLLAILCKKHDIHFTYLGTGCIFSNDNPPSFQYEEDAKPDFFGSSYSVVKGFTDRLMHMFNNTLNVRIRMPITDHVHPRNFITKITNYEKVCSIPNSMTVLPDLLPVMLDMVKNELTGTINLTNPGVISHNEILDMYTQIVDPTFTYTNFTLDEQDKILASKRSNNMLSTDLLHTLYPDIPDIKTSVELCLIRMRDQPIKT